jgi:hypothetical protein
VELDEQQADLDGLNAMVANLKEGLEDAAFATINHIVEVVRRTAHEGKLERLRNAALHVALDDGPDQPIQDILLSILDVLTVLHIRLLDSQNAAQEARPFRAGRKAPLPRGRRNPSSRWIG